jgi:hypothetical protein
VTDCRTKGFLLPQPEGRRWEDAGHDVARGGGVLAWDKDELRDTMNLSSEHHGFTATLRDFLQAVPHLVLEQVRRGDLSGHVRR